jgi:hypothetical protein
VRVITDRYGAAEHCVRDDEAALTDDYVVCNVNKVVDPCAGADLSAPVSALIYARVSPNVHVSFKQHALRVITVLTCAILERVVTKAWLPNASVRSDDAAFADPHVWPDVNARKDDR